MSTCAIVGINWGDEGKGRMVDLLAEQFNIVVRYQGGSNAGHTVINEFGKFALNLLPSGIFRSDVINVLGNGVALDPEHLSGEIDRLRSVGVIITPDNLKISDRACIVFPFHKLLDELEEIRLSDKKYGSTKRGIAPIYGDKYQKKAIQAGEVLTPDYLRERLHDIVAWKNLTISGVYGAKPIDEKELWDWCEKFLLPLAPFICNTGKLLEEAHRDNKSILFEAQLGALRDIDYGIYPYSTSSSPLASYAPIGSGAPWIQIDDCLGVVKAFSTCVGEGPFVVELFGEEAEKLREIGNEYGAATGRPRRVGPLDLVATRYGVRVQGATQLALTKLDVLSYMDKIPVCVAYKLKDGTITTDFPFTPYLYGATPIIEYFDGFNCDISGIREYDKLPKAAREYIEYIEEKVDCKITYISVGPKREEIIIR
ncbi:MAG TPA: adenylosuccinate synthase [Clostridiales bacterium]|jgi:adenylosuccinate synthase|nr:adenylosuccinate synthase [Clostridiales bacterium]